MDPNKNLNQTESHLHFLDYWRIIRIRKTVILAVFLLVVITATLVTFILPESFSSTAKIRVEKNVTDITPSAENRNVPDTYDPYYLQTQFEIMKSAVILDKVIDSLDLNEAWRKKYGAETKFKTDETRVLLSRQIDLQPVRNTMVIQIRVYSDKPEEAAKIANAIADTYQAYRITQAQQVPQGGIDNLKKTLEEQDVKVRAKQKEVDDLRTKLKVNDDMSSGNSGSRLSTADNYRDFDRLRIDGEARLIGKKTLLANLKALDPEKLKQVLPTAAPDTQLSELQSQLALAEQTVVKLSKDFGPENSELIKAKAQVEDLKKKIDDRVDGIIKGLETQVASAEAELEKIKSEVKKAQDEDLAKSESSRPYFDAKRELEDLLRVRSILQMKIELETADVKLPRKSMVDIVERAIPVLTPVRPNKPLNIGLGIVVGLVVGVGLAFFIEYLDTSVKTIDDVERALGCPVLGVIPQNVGYVLYEGAESPHAEAYRVLRTNLLFSRKDDKLNSICVVSAGAGEGKTTTAVNLATVFAQSGQRVLIVDSDLRRPTLHKVFRVANNVGLTSYLLKQNTLEDVIQTTSLSTLNFLPSGKLPSSSLGILSSPQMKDLISELKQRFDFVVFDSPPMMGVSDASVLASEVDMTLQVIQYRRYPQPMNIRAKQMIEKVGGTLIGIVLNNINMSQDESYYYYSGYYHDYYYAKKEGDAGEKPEANAGDKAKPEIKQQY